MFQIILLCTKYSFLKNAFFSPIMHPDISLPHLLLLTVPLTSSCPQIHCSSISFRRVQAFQGYQPNTAQQVTLRLGTNSHIKTGQGNPISGKGFQEQARVRGIPHSYCYECHKNNQLHNNNIFAEDLAQNHEVSVSPCEVCLTDSAGRALVSFLNPLTPTILPPPLLWSSLISA